MALIDYFIIAITLLIIIAVVSTIMFIIIFIYFKIQKLFIKKKAPKDLLEIKKEVLKNGNQSQEIRGTESSSYNPKDRDSYFRGFTREINTREQQFKEPTDIKRFDSGTMGDSRKFKFSE